MFFCRLKKSQQEAVTKVDNPGINSPHCRRAETLPPNPEAVRGRGLARDGVGVGGPSGGVRLGQGWGGGGLWVPPAQGLTMPRTKLWVLRDWGLGPRYLRWGEGDWPKGP